MNKEHVFVPVAIQVTGVNLKVRYEFSKPEY